MTTTFKVGDRVKYSAKFLKSIGPVGGYGQMTGTVTGIDDICKGLVLVKIKWDEGFEGRVNSVNLILATELHLEPA